MISDPTTLKATLKQQEFIQAALSGKYRYMLFGGAIRGGKTLCMLMLLFILCRIYPKSRWAIVRKDLPTIRRNIIPSFERFRPAGFVGPINKQTWIAKCTNGSEIIFFPESYATDKDLDRWKGLEVNGFVLEEMNELEGGDDTFNKAIERAGSWNCPGKQPYPYVFGSCNPAQGFVKRLFYDKWAAGSLKEPFFYMPSKITDNPHLDPEYIKSLQNLPPEIYKRFVEGDWTQSDHPDQLIKYEWILDALNRELDGGKQSLGLDVAGRKKTGDKSVLATFEGPILRPLEEWPGVRTDQLATTILERIDKYSIDPYNVAIDTIGVGAGVWNNLKRDGYECFEFVAGANAVDIEQPLDGIRNALKFKNLKAQAWWTLRCMFENGDIMMTEEHQGLIEDLLAIRYQTDSEKVITIESKKKTKERLNRSPDYGDAVMMAVSPRPELDEIVIY